MSTIREIARELNLSHTTVSRVLNARNEQTISAATRERVRETALRMGYRPHAAALALATGKTGQVGLLMHYLYTAFHAQVVHEFERIARRAGYQVLIATLDTGDSADDGRGLSQLPRNVDGYLAFESAEQIADKLGTDRPGHSALPVVALGGHRLGSIADRVAFDLAAGTDAAMEHLLASGQRRIAFLAEERDDPRRIRYHAALAAAGLPAEHIVLPSQRREDARAVVQARFAPGAGAGTAPDALFCFNDEIAIGAHRGLRDVGLRIPQDVAVVGFDGIEDTAYLDPALTTVALPIADMCRLAWESLQRRMADPGADPCRHVLRPTLVVRQSTGGSINTSPSPDVF